MIVMSTKEKQSEELLLAEKVVKQNEIVLFNSPGAKLKLPVYAEAE